MVPHTSEFVVQVFLFASIVNAPIAAKTGISNLMPKFRGMM